MKAVAWNPAAFDYHFQRHSISERDVVWKKLSSTERKLYSEWKTFRCFARSEYAPPIDVDSVTLLQPDSCFPPAPDIACRINRAVEYFELGEIIEEDLARAEAEALKAGNSTYGGPVNLWQAFDAILAKKFGKLYCRDATPVSLLIYYGVGRQPSFWEYLKPEIKSNLTSLQERLHQSAFQGLWVFDGPAETTLLHVTATTSVFS